MNRIALLVQNLDQTGPARIVRGASLEARRRGYALDIIILDSDDGFDSAAVDRALDWATESRIAALLTSGQSDALIDHVARRELGVPIGHQVESDGQIDPVNHAAGWLAADHLVELGHRAIGYLGGPPGWDASRDRERGFRERLSVAGLDPVWVRAGDWSAQSASDQWDTLGPGDRDVTAVSAANDSMAIGLIAAFSAAGIRVPEDVSIIGIDDLPEARFHVPSLSTIAMDHEGQGALSMSKVIDLIEGVESTQSERLHSPVVHWRHSSRRISPR